MRIDEYEYGRIVIDGREQRRDVIVTPSGVHANWWREQGHSLAIDDLGPVLDDPPQVLVVGTGTAGNMRPRPGLREELTDRGIDLVAVRTDEAVRRFNELLGLGDVTVAAALHLTC
jgi:hypothetical protein